MAECLRLTIARLETHLQELEWEGHASEAAAVRERLEFLRYKVATGQTHDYDF